MKHKDNNSKWSLTSPPLKGEGFFAPLDKLSEDLKVEKVLSLNMYSTENKKISVLKVYGKSKKTKEYVIWIKLNRLIYATRLFLWSFLKRKLSKEIL